MRPAGQIPILPPPNSPPFHHDRHRSPHNLQPPPPETPPGLVLARADSVFVAEPLGEAGLASLRAAGFDVVCRYDLSPEDFDAECAKNDAVVIRSASKVTAATIEGSKGRLRVVGRAGVGVDNVDLKAATANGCLVVNAPTANTVAAAEHGVALLCSLARMVPQATASVKAGEWKRTRFVGASLGGKTLAVLGFGKVGGLVARMAAGLGMTVVAYDPYASEERAAALGVELLSFDDALARGDFFSLHMPLMDSTRNLLDETAMRKMKKGARIVNVARGGVLCEDALFKLLDEGHLAGAALDVFAKEPVDPAHPLLTRDDVIVTPHLGASTVEAQEDVAVEVADSVVAALRGEVASTAINAPMVPKEVLTELRPYISLAKGLGAAAVQLLDGSGVGSLSITYISGRDALDTRLLRAMVLKGILEHVTDTTVNLVNADLVASQFGIDVTEVTKPVATKGGDDGVDARGAPLDQMRIDLSGKARFDGAVLDGSIHLRGEVSAAGEASLVRLGMTDCDIGLEGDLLLCQQNDRPGVIGAVGTLLADSDVNVSTMSVGRKIKRGEAVMAVGTDEKVSEETLAAIRALPSIEQAVTLHFPRE